MLRFTGFFAGVLTSLSFTGACYPADDVAQGSFPPKKPLFSRHVVPLFSKLGCNAGTCHGKVKGENGFRLSLFGADSAADHASLLREFAGRRVNLGHIKTSLLLVKSTGTVPHGGGKLMSVDSPEYRLLYRWLEQGARLNALDKSRVVKLIVSPSQKTIKSGENFSLRVQATFSDGSTEDVTKLCRFEPAGKGVVSVDVNGRVKAEGVGDTAIIVRYGAEPVVAMAFVPGPPTKFPQISPRNFIDRHVLAKLKRLNVAPNGLCDDATFLRRVTLDVTGALPEPEEIRKFLARKDPAKRKKKIDELLKRPGYSALWATKFCDILRPSGYNGNYAFVEAAENRRFYEWIRARVKENLPYDQLAERILTATSREGRSFEAWVAEVMAIAEENARGMPNLSVYSKRKTLDLYWQRQNATGIKGTIQVAHAFLGLRLECAQCHRHPHDVWSQDDLLSFANFFMRVKGSRYPNKKALPPAIAKMLQQLPKDAKKIDQQLKTLRDKKLRSLQNEIKKTKSELDRTRRGKDQGKIKPLEQRLAQQTAEQHRLEKQVAELTARSGRMKNGPKRFGTEVRHQSQRISYASVSSPLGRQSSNTLRLLGEDKPIKVSKEQDARVLVVKWMKRADNAFFAKAIVNRVWAHYFGRGLVDPPDHLSPLNPASHPELLKELAGQFIKNGYDLHWLHRTITTSRTYQQSSTAPVRNARAAARNYAFLQYRRLPAEVLVDAVNQATGTESEYPGKLYTPKGAKAVEVAGVTRSGRDASSLAYALKIFGRPARSTEVQCDCERDNAATIVQTLYLANHPRVREKIYSKNGRAADILKQHPENGRRIEEMFLSTVSRLPNSGERQICLKYVKQRKSSLRAFQDVLWSLINTREFILNH